MSKIEDMLKRLCPNGVERVSLQDCCDAIFSGGTPLTSHKEYYDGNIAWIRSGEIDFNRIYEADRNITIEGLGNSSAKIIRPKSVVMAMTGATVAKVATIEAEVSANQSVCALEPKECLNYRYLFFYLVDNYHQLKSRAQGALTSLNLQRIKKIEIPLPPLTIQREIVSVLDSFTTLIYKMKHEVELRKKQMEYYREKLICEQNYPLKAIGEIGDIDRGSGLQKKDFTESGIGCIHYGQIYTCLNSFCDKTLTFVMPKLAERLTKVHHGDLVIACTSENIEDVCKSVVWLGEEDIVTGGHACVLRHKESPKYISYCFQTLVFASQKTQFAYGVKVIDIKTDNIKKIEIPIPSISTQRSIVSTLDTFELYISKLERLITLREKQYAYYREKLLTFE